MFEFRIFKNVQIFKFLFRFRNFVSINLKNVRVSKLAHIFKILFTFSNVVSINSKNVRVPKFAHIFKICSDFQKITFEILFKLVQKMFEFQILFAFFKKCSQFKIMFDCQILFRVTKNVPFLKNCSQIQKYVRFLQILFQVSKNDRLFYF